jgi:hypothetical protein
MPAPLRTVDLAEPQGAFVYVETLRPLLPAGPGLFETTRKVGEELIAGGGYAFGGVVRDESGGVLTPSWLDARDYVDLDSSGGVAVAGSLSHTMFGRPAALDLGARDGSNVFGWGIEDEGRAPRWPDLAAEAPVHR